MATTTRRIVMRNGQLACSQCAYTGKLPRAGIFGNTSPRSRVAGFRGAFANHVCAKHPTKEA